MKLYYDHFLFEADHMMLMGLMSRECMNVYFVIQY